MKQFQTMTIICLLLLSVTMLAACGTTEFGLTENTGKQMTITAEKAGKDDFFMSGSLEVDDGEQIVITSNLTKGSVRLEIIGAPEGQSADELPEMSGDVIMTADVSGTEGTSEAVPPGTYLLKATCLEKATGTVQLEVEPVS